jgi:mRNA interferase YafQ
MRKGSQTTQFFRDLKKIRKRGKDLAKLRSIVEHLACDNNLHPKYRDHALIGRWRPSRDCHVEPDWILIYTIDKKSLRLERTGTHRDLFKK